MNILALDLGGTVLKSALFAGDATILRQGDCPSDGRLGGEALLRRAFQAIEAYGPFDRIAVSTTGQVDERTGSIAYANENVPGYTGTPVRSILENRYSVPVSVLNDVNAAALGGHIADMIENVQGTSLADPFWHQEAKDLASQVIRVLRLAEGREPTMATLYRAATSYEAFEDYGKLAEKRASTGERGRPGRRRVRFGRIPGGGIRRSADPR